MTKNPLAKASENLALEAFFDPRFITEILHLVITDTDAHKELCKEVTLLGQKILHDAHKRDALGFTFVHDIANKHICEMREAFADREVEVLCFYLGIFGHYLPHSKEWFGQQDTSRDGLRLLKIASKFYAAQGSG